MPFALAAQVERDSDGATGFMFTVHHNFVKGKGVAHNHQAMVNVSKVYYLSDTLDAATSRFEDDWPAHIVLLWMLTNRFEHVRMDDVRVCALVNPVTLRCGAIPAFDPITGVATGLPMDVQHAQRVVCYFATAAGLPHLTPHGEESRRVICLAFCVWGMNLHVLMRRAR